MKKVICFVLGFAMAINGWCGSNEKIKKVIRVGTWKTQQTIQPFLYDMFFPRHIFLGKQYACDVKPFTNPGDMKTALLAGSLDICGTTIVHAILSASQGQPVVIICRLCDKASALVVGTNSGINRGADLKGKRIGYVPSTMHHILLLEVLHNAGLSEKDVRLIRVDFFDMVAALSHGQIDAFLSGEPYPTLAVRNGVGRILSYPYFDETIGPINAGMLTTRDFVKNNPDVVQAVVTAHARATRYLQGNRSEWIRRAAEFGSPPEVLEQSADNIELSWDMDAKFLKQVKMLGEKMKELGMIENLPDWEKLVDTRFVEKVRHAKY